MPPNPAELAPSAVHIPDAELREAIVLDSTSELGTEIRCTIASLDPLLATDPMPWSPYVTPAGFFYPKKGDRAVLGFPPDGPPVILEWWPNASEPDQTF
jgi:hypothetical protein